MILFPCSSVLVTCLWREHRNSPSGQKSLVLWRKVKRKFVKNSSCILWCEGIYRILKTSYWQSHGLDNSSKPQENTRRRQQPLMAHILHCREFKTYVTAHIQLLRPKVIFQNIGYINTQRKQLFLTRCILLKHLQLAVVRSTVCALLWTMMQKIKITLAENHHTFKDNKGFLFLLTE